MTDIASSDHTRQSTSSTPGRRAAPAMHPAQPRSTVAFNDGGTLPQSSTITSPFWKKYRTLIHDEVLPYQWAVMNDDMDPDMPDDPAGNQQDTHNSHAIRNLRIAAGEQTGHHAGFPFQDTDAYKWLEAAAYTLEYRHDPDLKTIADNLVDLIATAQEPDGYLDTLFQIDMPGHRLKRLQQSHELYSMGHYIEAAVAYHHATGNATALRVATDMADYIDSHFGEAPNKIHGADGHPEIEFALTRLYETTGERRYLDLAHYLLNVRGVDPLFYQRQNEEDGIASDPMQSLPLTYCQAAEPIADQATADGHAVRVVYLCAGMARVAALTGDSTLLDACHRFWNDIVNRRMFITGGIGSTQKGESFTYDYDLPNDTMYGETCAAVGMAFFARAMLSIDLDGSYGDVLEKELFNGALAGMSLDGKHFFYVNPLEADPEASRGNPGRAHVLTRRAEWFGCACCPSNIARLIASVNRYLYTVTSRHGRDVIAAHQFISNDTRFANGVGIAMTSELPWGGHVRFAIDNPEHASFLFAVRIPGWSARRYSLSVDGRRFDGRPERGFVYVPIEGGNATISLDLDMRVSMMRASSRVRADIGKLAVQRGPLVFCAEQCDNDAPLWLYSIGSESETHYEFRPDLLIGLGTVTVSARKRVLDHDSSPLYRMAEPEDGQTPVDAKLVMVPYFAWANRDEGRMQVWQESRS